MMLGSFGGLIAFFAVANMNSGATFSRRFASHLDMSIWATSAPLAREPLVWLLIEESTLKHVMIRFAHAARLGVSNDACIMYLMQLACTLTCHGDQ
jgi:hypothetical protein